MQGLTAGKPVPAAQRAANSKADASVSGIYPPLTQKNSASIRCGIFLTGSSLSSRTVSSRVLSAYKGLTAVFGMGTGGSP